MARLVVLKTLDCGCRIIWNCSTNEDNIEFCRLHGAAGELLEACREFQQLYANWDGKDFDEYEIDWNDAAWVAYAIDEAVRKVKNE